LCREACVVCVVWGCLGDDDTGGVCVVIGFSAGVDIGVGVGVEMIPTTAVAAPPRLPPPLISPFLGSFPLLATSPSPLLLPTPSSPSIAARSRAAICDDKRSS